MTPETIMVCVCVWSLIEETDDQKGCLLVCVVLMLVRIAR